MDDFQAYVERFAACHHITVEEAMEYKIVQEVKKSYEEKEADDNPHGCGWKEK